MPVDETPFRRGTETAECEWCHGPLVKMTENQTCCSNKCRAAKHNEERKRALKHYRSCPNVKGKQS